MQKFINSAAIKRLFDIALALFGLVVFSPVGLIAAIAIKKEDGGPVFYRQQRWGRGGVKFEALKFRSMVPDADRAAGFRPAGEHDSRITRTGKALRATAMDELPQLLNILRGDMSFVGPRALSIEEIDPAFPGFAERHRLQPGLTGTAQVHASRDATLQEKFQYDLEYVKKRTLWSDISLIFLSFWVTLRGKWESRGKKF